MTSLILGLAIFILLHLVPVFARTARNGVAAKIGELPYKGLFALASFGGLYFTVVGWKATEISLVYSPPSWGMHVTPLFVLVAFILFIGSRAPGNARTWVRNPQLTAVFLWAIGHLFSNGENRSVLLFGAFAAWSLIAIWGSNRRDPAWQAPAKKFAGRDVVTLVIAAALYAGFVGIHEWLIGVAPMP